MSKKTWRSIPLLMCYDLLWKISFRQCVTIYCFHKLMGSFLTDISDKGEMGQCHSSFNTDIYYQIDLRFDRIWEKSDSITILTNQIGQTKSVFCFRVMRARSNSMVALVAATAIVNKQKKSPFICWIEVAK